MKFAGINHPCLVFIIGIDHSRNADIYVHGFTNSCLFIVRHARHQLTRKSGIFVKRTPRNRIVAFVTFLKPCKIFI